MKSDFYSTFAQYVQRMLRKIATQKFLVVQPPKILQYQTIIDRDSARFKSFIKL